MSSSIVFIVTFFLTLSIIVGTSLPAAGKNPVLLSNLPIGTWNTFINSLPALQLPSIPIVGNGHLGAAFNSRSTSAIPSTHVGPGDNNTLDIWLSTNSQWSCKSCDNSDDPDHVAKACCSTIALGGVSIRFDTLYSTPLTFTGSQVIANATITTQWTTSYGGTVKTVTNIHPIYDIMFTNVTYLPSSMDPPTININVSTWVLGNGQISGSWNTAVPVPSSVGCSSSSSSLSSLSYVSRNGSSINSTLMPVSGALVTGIYSSSSSNIPSCTVTSYVNVYPPTVPWESTLSITLGGNSSFMVVTSVSNSHGYPLNDTVSMATDQIITYSSTLSLINQRLDETYAWWSSYWNLSSISLPSQPLIESFWFGSQYALAVSSSTSFNLPAPGLYGPFMTTDGPNWHGDLTLDYNAIAPYFGVFGSNHIAQSESYYKTILDWLPAGEEKAQIQAGYAKVTCPSSATYYACHIAPWGLQSLDPMTKYMSWNGHYTTLPFINHFEYTRNSSFAINYTLPLLNSLNQWWACYLNKTMIGPDPSDYVYMDNNVYNPDYEHEGQIVPNPQIALAFMYRTLTAQVDISRQLNLPVPPNIYDVYTHLPSLNTHGFNMSISTGNFTLLNNTRCRNDEQTWYNVPDYLACEDLCASSSTCGLFSYCPPVSVYTPLGGCSGNNDEPKPNTCWGYDKNQLPNCVTNNTGNFGWISGVKNSTAFLNTTIYTAYLNAIELTSDSFATYPVWPTESIEFPPFYTMNDTNLQSQQQIAQASSRVYSDFINGRPVDLFSVAVRSGYNSSYPPSWSPSEVIQGLNGYLQNYYRTNLLPYAPGGGIENIGISRAVNEMLVSSWRIPSTYPSRNDNDPKKRSRTNSDALVAQYVIQVFPFWPTTEDAAFTGMLVKGGFLISASFRNGTVQSPVSIISQYNLNIAPTTLCTFVNPWVSVVPITNITVNCTNVTVPVQGLFENNLLQFTIPPNTECFLTNE